MFHPTIEVAETHRQEILRYAQTAELLRKAGISKTGLHERLLWKTGDSLVTLGQKLKDRYNLEPRESYKSILFHGFE